MRQREVEELASDFRIKAGVLTDDVLLAPEIAARALGQHSLHVVDRMVSRACVGWIHGKPHIYVRRDAPDKNFLIAHECGHIVLRNARFAGPLHDEERLASLIGAAILAPPRAVHRAYIAFGEKPNRIAQVFTLSQTATILRIAEVRIEDRAVVTANDNVMARGFDGVDHVEIRRWARHTPALGIRRVRLSGQIDEGRVAIRKAV